MKSFFSPSPLWQNQGLTILRIVVGIFMIYHGWQAFDANAIKEYAKWDVFKNFSSPSLLVYLGKISELLAGILLVIGCFTRLACIIMIVTMLFISFVIGNGKIFYEDQYPFLFAILGLVFFFTGAGKWSIDNYLFGNKS